MNFKDHLRNELNENWLRLLMKGYKKFDFADDYIEPGGFTDPLRTKARELDAANLDELMPPVGTVSEVLDALRGIQKPVWFNGSEQAWANLITELIRDLPIVGIPANHPLLQMLSQLTNWITSGASMDSLLQMLQQPSTFGQFFSSTSGSHLFHLAPPLDGSFGPDVFGLNPSVLGGLNLDDYFSVNNISAENQVIINGLNSIFEFLNDLGLTN